MKNKHLKKLFNVALDVGCFFYLFNIIEAIWFARNTPNVWVHEKAMSVNEAMCDSISNFGIHGATLVIIFCILSFVHNSLNEDND